MNIQTLVNTNNTDLNVLNLQNFVVEGSADDDSKVFVLYLADCFQPPLYAIMADSLETAINEFVEQNFAQCQIIDNLEDYDLDTVYYNDGGTMADIEALQCIELDINTQTAEITDLIFDEMIGAGERNLKTLVKYLISEKDLSLSGLISNYQELPDKLTYDHYGLDIFEYDSIEYAIGDDRDATQAATCYIKDSVWAFNSDFLQYHISALDSEDIDNLRGDRCEDANSTLLKLIDDMDYFVNDAITSDGRGHFINSYDGNEIDYDNCVIYRIS